MQYIDFNSKHISFVNMFKIALFDRIISEIQINQFIMNISELYFSKHEHYVIITIPQNYYEENKYIDIIAIINSTVTKLNFDNKFKVYITTY